MKEELDTHATPPLRASQVKPYYEHAGVTIYHGDCREILPGLEADAVVTDPPYGIAFESGWTGDSIKGDGDVTVRDDTLALCADLPALVFGSIAAPEPQGVRARLVWHRPGSGMGDLSLPWKPDFEIVYVIGQGFSHAVRGAGVLVFPWDTFRGAGGHPHRKPMRLMAHLIERCPGDTILDPFMGSGTTLRAAKDLGRKAIGIEIEEKYCEIAAKRLGQEVLPFE